MKNKKMKRIIFLCVWILLAIQVTAQINGGFYYEQDVYGNTYPFFRGINVSGYNLNIKIDCFNRTTRESKTLYLTPLYAGRYFTIGIRDNWLWQPEEVLIITYQNGQCVMWTYLKKTSGISFSGTATGRYCTADGHTCKCPGFVPKGKGGTYCKNCEHACYFHPK